MAQEDTLRLSIVFDGTVSGLAEHRLSVSAFAESLKQLVAAYRGIASGLLSDMLGTPDYRRTGGGRYAERARHIDLEIIEITHNSPLRIEFAFNASVPVAIDPQLSLFASPPPLMINNGFLKRVSDIFLDGLEAESKGEMHSFVVRRYLDSLPQGLSQQVYKLKDEEREIRMVTLRDVKLPQLPPPLPYLDQLTGNVVGVGFTPGPTEIRIRQEGGSIVTLAADEEQVASALSLRENPVMAMVLMGNTKKLLWMRKENEAKEDLTHEDVTAYIFKKWENVLRRLAE